MGWSEKGGLVSTQSSSATTLSEERDFLLDLLSFSVFGTFTAVIGVAMDMTE